MTAMRETARRVIGRRCAKTWYAGFRAEDGQTVTEYGAVLAILIIALSGVVFAMHDEIASFIDKVVSALAAILP